MKSRTILMVMAALIGFALGCGGGDGSTSHGQEKRTIRGQLTDVTAASLLEIESITLQTETGESYVLEAGNRIISGFTPSHLREHMLQGTSVTVKFHQDGDRMVLDDVLD